MHPLTAERAWHAFHYDPLTGLITWRSKIACKVVVGAVAGNINSTDGYVQIRLDGQLHRGHRLAWLLVTGVWPDYLVDHRNGNRSDNRWVNLRDVSNATNMQNRLRPNCNNAFGLLGVSLNSATGKPFAQIMVAGKNINLGSFDTPELAHAAYMEAKAVYHPGCYFHDAGARDAEQMKGATAHA